MANQGPMPNAAPQSHNYSKATYQNASAGQPYQPEPFWASKQVIESQNLYDNWASNKRDTSSER